MQKRKLSFICLSVVLMTGAVSLQAQDRTISGIVTAFDSIPLAEAQVFIKSSGLTVFTDAAGKFEAPVRSKRDKLKIIARGFVQNKVKVTKEMDQVDVNLKLNPKVTENVYDVGYGYLLEENRSTATSNMAKNEASFSRYSSIFDMVAGQFPGVEVRNEEFIIRGSNTFNSSAAALIVLDGVIMESSDFLRSLRPVQVKDINVIKDGGAAIYGSRGANGVVLIETLKGGDTMK